MDNLGIFPLVTTLMAFTSALVCCLLEVVAVCDSATARERRMKTLLLVYFTCLSVIWGSFMVNQGVFLNSKYAGVAFLAALNSVPVLFCNLIVMVTAGREVKFSSLHYVFPLAYAFVYLVLSVLISESISHRVFYDRDYILTLSGSYPVFSGFVYSVGYVRVVISVIYGIPSLRMIYKFHKVKKGQTQSSPGGKWLTLYLFLGISLFVNALLMLSAALSADMKGPAMVMGSVAITFHIIIMGYNSLDRKSLFLSSVTGETGDPLPVPPPLSFPTGRSTLDRKLFDDFYIAQKRYLDHRVRMTDLVQPLCTNRTTLSSFINRTYGMNFSRLTAELRLKELEKIRREPSNKGKPLSELIPKAGFSTERSYYFARKNCNPNDRWNYPN